MRQAVLQCVVGWSYRCEAGSLAVCGRVELSVCGRYACGYHLRG